MCYTHLIVMATAIGSLGIWWMTESTQTYMWWNVLTELPALA